MINIKYNDEVFLVISDEDQIDMCHKLESSHINDWVKHVIEHFPKRLIKRAQKQLSEDNNLPPQNNAPSGITLKFNDEIIYQPNQGEQNILETFHIDNEVKEVVTGEITRVVTDKISNCQKAVEDLAYSTDPETGQRRIPNPPTDKAERRNLVRAQGWYKNRDQREAENPIDNITAPVINADVIAMNPQFRPNAFGSSADFPVLFRSVVKDASGDYNKSDGSFTVNRDGNYLFEIDTYLTGLDMNSSRISLYLKRGNNSLAQSDYWRGAQGWSNLVIKDRFVLVNLKENDKIDILIYANSPAKNIMQEAGTANNLLTIKYVT